MGSLDHKRVEWDASSIRRAAGRCQFCGVEEGEKHEEGCLVDDLNMASTPVIVRVTASTDVAGELVVLNKRAPTFAELVEQMEKLLPTVEAQEEWYRRLAELGRQADLRRQALERLRGSAD